MNKKNVFLFNCSRNSEKYVVFMPLVMYYFPVFLPLLFIAKSLQIYSLRLNDNIFSIYKSTALCEPNTLFLHLSKSFHYHSKQEEAKGVTNK